MTPLPLAAALAWLVHPAAAEGPSPYVQGARALDALERGAGVLSSPGLETKTNGLHQAARSLSERILKEQAKKKVPAQGLYPAEGSGWTAVPKEGRGSAPATELGADLRSKADDAAQHELMGRYQDRDGWWVEIDRYGRLETNVAFTYGRGVLPLEFPHRLRKGEDGVYQAKGRLQGEVCQVPASIALDAYEDIIEGTIKVPKSAYRDCTYKGTVSRLFGFEKEEAAK